MKPDKLWKLVLEDLQVSLSQANFASWIKPLSYVQSKEVSGGRYLVDIDCPSSFHRSIIEKRFYGQISEALSRVLEQPTEVRLNVNAALSNGESEDAGPLFASPQPQEEEVGLQLHRHGLREDFVFDTFAVSSSNEMAHAAAQAVAKNLGAAYNPLFLYGGVGVGKTHLTQAVAIEALKKTPEAKFIYCAGEEFTNEIIDAIQQKTTREFKKRYRQVKALFVDDIQFIAGKTTVQEEFFHTFNAILKGGGQVVLTSDRPPSEINKLEDRLRSRFEAGLIVDIGEPNFELRTAILLIKAKQRNLSLKMEIAQMIAANIQSARQIEGFLTRLMSESKLKNRDVTEGLVTGLLGTSMTDDEKTPPPLRPLEIVRGVAAYYEQQAKEVRGKGRSRNLVRPRHMAMYLLRVDYNLPLTDIGEFFSNRDHTTVMHAVDKITQRLKDSEELRIDLSELRRDLYSWG